jgi:hypothetical protein
MLKLSLVSAFLLLPSALTAQTDSTYPAPAAQDTQAAPTQNAGPVTVFTYTFSAPNEFVRANLQAGVTYEAELNSRGVTLTVRPRQSGIQRPDVRKDMMGSSASGSTTFLIKPFVDAEYEFRCTNSAAGANVMLTVRTKN